MLRNLQYGVLDVQAMSMAFAAVRVAPWRHMTAHRPPQRISSVPNLVVVGLGAVFVCLSQVLIVLLLRSSASFKNANGGTYKVVALMINALHHCACHDLLLLDQMYVCPGSVLVLFVSSHDVDAL